jgi:hypothetical protein
MRTHSDQDRCSSSSLDVPAGFCRRIVEALGALKEQLHERYASALPGRRQLVREVIAEAEELAWRTPFPHLFLPDFAEARLEALLALERQSVNLRLA